MIRLSLAESGCGPVAWPLRGSGGSLGCGCAGRGFSGPGGRGRNIPSGLVPKNLLADYLAETWGTDWQAALAHSGCLAELGALGDALRDATVDLAE